MATRQYHVVRCKHPSDEQTYVDVAVLDKVTAIGPNGEENLFDCSAASARPFIVDKVGSGSAKGSQSNCTRSSHMEKVGGADASFFIEVIDACHFTGPNHTELGLIMPAKASIARIVDNTDGGFSADPDKATRRSHITKLTSEDNPDDALYIQRTDILNFLTANHTERALILTEGDAKDTTKYDKDGNPPDNTDPNVYVKFPDDARSPWLGKIKIDQGPLWWIKAAKGGGNWLVIEVFEQASNQITGTSIVMPDPISGMTVNDIGGSASLTGPTFEIGGTAPMVNPVSPEMRKLDAWNPGSFTQVQHIIGYVNFCRSVTVVNLGRMKRFLPRNSNIFTFTVGTGGCPATTPNQPVTAYAIKWLDHCGGFGFLPGNWVRFVYLTGVTGSGPGGAPTSGELFTPGGAGTSIDPYAQADLNHEAGLHTGGCPSFFFDEFLDFETTWNSNMDHIRNYVVRAGVYKGSKTNFLILQGAAQWDTTGGDPDALNAPAEGTVFQDSGGLNFNGSPSTFTFQVNMKTSEVGLNIT